MSARDDFGSDAGRPGGRGGSNGGLANGGVGGGRGGGGGGGGAGRNGGYGSNTGLQTGNTWYGNTALGRPGGRAGAYGMRDKYGNISNLKDWYGNPINPNPSVQQSPLNRPSFPGVPVAPVPAYYPPTIIPRTYVPSKIHQWFDPPPVEIPRTYVPSKIHQWFDPPPPANGPVYSQDNPYNFNTGGGNSNHYQNGSGVPGKDDFLGDHFNGNMGYY